MGTDRYPLLTSPLRVGRLIWRNRIQTGPMSMTELGPGETLSRDNIAFYERLAEGGAAVVTVGESIIPTENGKTHGKQIMLGNPDVYASLARAADAIHAQGALADIEISHGGIMADPVYNNGKNLIGPVGLFDDYAGEVLGMDEGMMDAVADAFADATETVRRCGFDMAMIHAGHGWLLSQFLSPLYNKREDAYGGSRENRMRFPLTVLKRVRDRVGRDYALDMRVSGSEFLEGGAEIEDCIAFCAEAQEYVDVINVSAGAPWTTRMVPSVFDERGINAVFAAAVKKAVDIPVTTVGGFADPAHMERVLADGLADGIVMGRGIIADPDIPNKAKNGDQNARKCIRCFVCNEALYTTRNLRCSVNPTAGREFERKLARPAAKSKRVLVAGGGPGGMVAAVAAAKRGHCVTLFEKSDALGGALKTERFIPFKQDIVDFGRTLERELYAAGVDVRLGAPLTPETAAPAAADAVIAALGARPFIPPIAGADGPRVFTAESFLSGGADTRASAVIIVGGGLVGAELGLHLALLGIRATILEMRGGIAADAAPEYRRFLLAETEKQKDMLRCETGLRCTRVADGTVAAVPVGGGAEMLFGADAVILAAGYLPLRDEAEALRRCAPEFRVVGDCNRVARIYEAVRSGYDAGTGV